MKFFPRTYDLFDDVFDDMFNTPFFTGRNNGLMRTDITEKDDHYLLDVELPGCKKEDIQIGLRDGYLNISASRNSNKEEKDDKGNLIRQERYSGSFSRSFYVGEDMTEEDIKGEFKHGILKLFVPKKEAKPAVPERKFIAIEG